MSEEAEKIHEPDEHTGKKQKEITISLDFFKKHAVFLAVVAIFMLSFYVRTASFDYNYLLNVDSYFHYRYTKTIVDTGGVPDTDYLMVAPEGFETSVFARVPSLYNYLGAYSYKLALLFFPGMELWEFLVYFPAVLASLMAVPAYYIGRAIYDRKAGLITAFLTVFNPAIFMRSIGGDPDSDAIVMLMPLIVMMFFLLSYKIIEKKEEIKKIIAPKPAAFAALTGIFLAAFAFTWGGYWYMFMLITGFVFLMAGLKSFRMFRKGQTKEIIGSVLPYLANYIIVIAVFFLLTMPWFGYDFPVYTLSQPFQSAEMKAETGNYPNVYVSVQEMMASGDIKEVVQRTGTIYFFLTFVCCMPYLMGAYYKKRIHGDTMALILLWAGGALFASLVAVRFSILLAFPVSLGSGIILAKAWRMMLGQDKEVFE